MHNEIEHCPLVIVPLAPILALLIAGYVGMLDAGLLIVRIFTKDEWPAPLKIWVCSIVTIVGGIYRYQAARQNPQQLEAIERIQEQGNFRPAISNTQSALLLVFLFAVVFFGVWVLYC